jgi:hypothetical protein
MTTNDPKLRIMPNVTVIRKSRVLAIPVYIKRWNKKETNPMNPATRPLSSGTVKLQKYTRNANCPMLKKIAITRMHTSLKMFIEIKRRKTAKIEVANEHA